MNTLNKDDVDEEASLTIGDFCRLERFSKKIYHGLKQRGLGPEETCPPGTRVIRISPQSRREWHERMRELQNTRQAQLEAARRREQTVEAAKRSVESRRRDKAAIASPSPTSRRRPRIAEARR
jgi:hypothetical protein